MISAIDSALSGLANASSRFQTSANNISQFNTGKENSPLSLVAPKDVVSLSPEASEANPFTQQFDDAGVNAPGSTDLVNDIVNSQIASYDFRANLKTLQAVDNMQQSLLDIFS